MDFDDLLRRYFGTSQIGDVLGLEPDRGKRFALWSVLYLLGAAPDLDVAFADPADREAARNLMDLLAASAGEQR
jgi:hypothetical protein